MSNADDLYDEINAAIHAMLKEAYKNDLYWTSVGLLNQNNSIRWMPHINCEYKPSDNSLHPPCNQVDQRCTPKDGHSIPPCQPANITNTCNFRKGLNQLNEATMVEGSRSMGELSMLYFKAFDGAHPYISPEMHHNFPWIKYKSDLLGEIQSAPNTKVDESVQAKTKYDELAKQSMPDVTTAALVPLVQSHGSKNRYVGAIVLCANRESEIWGHLPRIKAVAIPLTEAHRRVVSMTPDETGDKCIPLLRELLKHPFGQHLYSNHNRWHDNQLISEIEGIASYFEKGTNWPNDNLPKGLFNYLQNGQLPDSNWRRESGRSGYDFPWGQLVKFLQDNFDLTLHLGDGLKENFPGWPTAPGLIALISLVRIYDALNNPNKTKGESVSRVFVKGEDKHLIWSFELSDATKIAKLEKRVWEKITNSNNPNISGGHTSSVISNALFGDLSNYKVSLASENKHVLFNQILDRSPDVPIFQAWFGTKTFNISWRTT